MSAIQESVKTPLTELADGRWPILDQEARLILSTWVTLFTTTIEFHHIPTVAVDDAQRKIFHLTQKPLPNWIIVMGLYNGREFSGNFWHRGAHVGNDEELLPQDVAEVVSKVGNTQTTTFAIGRAFFHALSAPLDILPDPAEYSNRLGTRLIWPTIGPPPAATGHFSDGGLKRVAMTFWRDIGIEY